MSIDEILAFILSAGFIVTFAVLVRRFWRAATNPNVAYRLGRKARQLGRTAGHAAVGIAHTAGRATGKVENVAGMVGRSFQDGRDSTKDNGRSQDGEI